MRCVPDLGLSFTGDENVTSFVTSDPQSRNDTVGKPMNPKTLSDKAKQLLDDYHMVQYDMTVGNNYLQKMGFMDLRQ